MEDVQFDISGGHNQFLPNATEAVQNIYAPPIQSRLASWFRQLQVEFEHDERHKQKLDDIKRYRTKLPHTIGLENKLKDGGFSDSDIKDARRRKQYFAKKMTKYQYFESAQRIDAYLFAMVANRFDTYVMPLICANRPTCDIKQATYEQVVVPVRHEIESNGADDNCLCYNDDDIYGMLYYLTGNCHLNWKDYDVHPSL